MVMIVKNIDYEHIDCSSIATGRKARVVKVQESEFFWPTTKGDAPTKQEIHLRKRQFLEQLEIGWAMQLKAQYESVSLPIHVLYLRDSYDNEWYDLIRLLFIIDPATPVWRTATLPRSLVTV